MDINAAGDWLNRFEAFWRVRGRFYVLAFGLDGDDPRRAKPIAGHEEFVSLNPEKARGIWDRALGEAGAGLSRQEAIELARMSSAERIERAETALRVLGFTPAGQRRFLPFMLQVEEEWPRDFWNWTVEHDIAGGGAERS